MEPSLSNLLFQLIAGAMLVAAYYYSMRKTVSEPYCSSCGGRVQTAWVYAAPGSEHTGLTWVN